MMAATMAIKSSWSAPACATAAAAHEAHAAPAFFHAAAAQHAAAAFLLMPACKTLQESPGPLNLALRQDWLPNRL